MAPTKEVMKKAFLKAAKLSLNDLKVALLEVAANNMEEKWPKMEKYGDDDDTIEVLLNLVDGDGDKKLTYDEFVEILESEDNDLVINAIKKADKDGSGYLNNSELRELLLKIDPKCKESKDLDEKINMIIKMTTIGDEKKAKVEEVIKLLTTKKDDSKQMIGAMFRMYDEDGDGFISKKELAKFMKIDDYDNADFAVKMMVEMMMMMIDQDEDGKLNYEEFCKIEIK